MTAVSLVVLGLAWSRLPRWRLPLSLVVASIVFSTVYLSLHYVADVVAGAALAAAMTLLWPTMERVFGPTAPCTVAGGS